MIRVGQSERTTQDRILSLFENELGYRYLGDWTDRKHMKMETIRVFALSRLSWIKEQQAKLRAQERESPRDYVLRETHYVWGKRFLLKVQEADTPAKVELAHSRLVLSVRPGTERAKREALVEAWYRDQLGEEAAGVFGVPRGPRARPPLGAHTQRPLCGLDGPLPSQLAAPSPDPQPVAGAPGDLELLSFGSPAAAGWPDGGISAERSLLPLV